MVTAKKNDRIKYMVIFVIFTLLMPFVIADESDKTNNPEVLTTLEQRMSKRISVNFRNTPIDDVIRIMAEQADVDIVKSPKVVGEVTTTLTDVPLSEALSNILTAHGYGYVTSKNLIRIAPLEEINERIEAMVSRIYRITYADVEEVEKALKKYPNLRCTVYFEINMVDKWIISHRNCSASFPIAIVHKLVSLIKREIVKDSAMRAHWRGAVIFIPFYFTSSSTSRPTSRPIR